MKSFVCQIGSANHEASWIMSLSPIPGSKLEHLIFNFLFSECTIKSDLVFKLKLSIFSVPFEKQNSFTLSRKSIHCESS